MRREAELALLRVMSADTRSRDREHDSLIPIICLLQQHRRDCVQLACAHHRVCIEQPLSIPVPKNNECEV